MKPRVRMTLSRCLLLVGAFLLGTMCPSAKALRSLKVPRFYSRSGQSLKVSAKPPLDDSRTPPVNSNMQLPLSFEANRELAALGASSKKRVAFLLKVKEGKIEEYKELHKKVWPEMLEALRRNGWHNYSLFLRKDGLLFGYFETAESFQAALKGMAKEQVNGEWQALMAPYFEALGGARPDEKMLELEEVFHLD